MSSDQYCGARELGPEEVLLSGLDLIEGPFGEPVTTAVAKSHAHVTSSSEDSLIEGYIKSARDVVQGFLKRILCKTTFTYRIDGAFPSEIILPVGPVVSSALVSIQYVADDGTVTTLATTEYQVSTGDVCRIMPAYGKAWPSCRPDYDAVRVTFSAGYAEGTTNTSPTDFAENVPQLFKDAVLDLVADKFEDRGPDGGDLTDPWKRRLRPYQRWA